MVIRRRAAVSNPDAYHEDQAIRICLRHGHAALCRERKEANEEFADTYTDTQLMQLDRQIAFLERMQQLEGLLCLETK